MSIKCKKVTPILEAWLWDESLKTLKEIGCGFAAYDGHVDTPDLAGNLKIRTLSGSVRVYKGDYIIKGQDGDFYLRGANTFKAHYEIV